MALENEIKKKVIRRLEDEHYFKSLDNDKEDVSFMEFLVSHTSKIHLYGSPS